MRAASNIHYLARICLVIGLALTVACGTLEVDLEPTAAAGAPATSTEASSMEPTQATEALPTSMTPVGAPADEAISEPFGEGDTVVLVGRAMTLDLPSGVVQLLPEDETPLADEFGSVSFRISEWARIADTEGNIVTKEDFGRGVKLQVTATLQNGELVTDEVLVLAPGNPPPDQNPAMTQVEGLVTPIAEPPAEAEGPIRLFEILGGDQPLEPGTAITLRWAYEGEGATLCSFQVPRPMNQTCYRDLPPSGEMTVNAPMEARDAVDYTLSVPLEERVAFATVRVELAEKQACQDEWFYAPEALLECPAGPASQVRVQAQNFENGLLVRVEDSWLGKAPYIFMWQWHADACQGQYCAITEGPIADPWEPGIPETDLALRPPEGFWQPSRGFGMLWRGDLEIVQMGDARTINGLERLGWATGAVFEYDARYQCESLNENFGIFNCHLELPDGRLAVLPGAIR